jgi:hypothetical protein
MSERLAIEAVWRHVTQATLQRVIADLTETAVGDEDLEAARSLAEEILREKETWEEPEWLGEGTGPASAHLDDEVHSTSVLDDPCAHDWGAVWSGLRSEVFAIVDPQGRQNGEARQLTGPPVRFWLVRDAAGIRLLDEDQSAALLLCVSQRSRVGSALDVVGGGA